MKLKNLNGREIYKNCTSYKVDWEQKCRSKIQRKVKEFLKKHWKNKLVYEEFPVYGSRMTLDIFCATDMVAIEIQGVQHGKFNKFFHSDDRGKFLSQIQRDCKKSDWCEMNEIRLVEITEQEVNSIDSQEKFDLLYNEHIKNK